MADIYDGDIGLRLTDDGCTADYSGGQPRMDAGLETAVVISLFSRGQNWPGNALDENHPDKQIMSEFEQATEARPITNNTLINVERTGKAALQWLVNIGAAKEVKVIATAPLRNRIDVSIFITKPDGAIKPFKYELNWDAGVFSGPINVGV